MKGSGCQEDPNSRSTAQTPERGHHGFSIHKHSTCHDCCSDKQQTSDHDDDDDDDDDDGEDEARRTWLQLQYVCTQPRRCRMPNS